MSTQNTTTNRPVHKIEDFPVTVSIWKNGDFYNVTIQRVYKDKETGKWRFSSTLRQQDLLPLGELLKQAYFWISQARRNAVSNNQQVLQNTNREDIKVQLEWDEEDFQDNVPF